MEQRDGEQVQALINSRSRLRIFISYRHGDDPAAAYLVDTRLRLEGGFSVANVFIDKGQKIGKSFVEQIEQAGSDCDVLIAIVGSRWLDVTDAAGRGLGDSQNWTRREIEAAFDRRIPIIPVLASGASMPPPERVPDRLARFVELQGVPISIDGDGQERLVARLDEIAQEIATTRIVNLRQRNSSFVGREELLAQIKNELDGIRGATAVAAIVGLPAVGKTQLAVEFAHRYQNDYRIIWEVPAEQRATCREKFGSLSRDLKLRQRQDQDLVAATRTALEGMDGWLLILDNVKDETDIEDLIPRSGGHVLITSQHATWELTGAVTFPLDVMTEEEAVALLRNWPLTGSDADLARLAGELMHIPLALEQASAYMRAGNMSVVSYLKLLRDNETEMLRRGLPRDYDRTLVDAWRLALGDLERTASEKAPGAVEILNLCAFMAPDDIPLETFGNYADSLPERAATVLADPIARTDAISLLAGYSQVRWSDDTSSEVDCVSLHRTVQYFTRERLDFAERQIWSDAAVGVVLAAFPDHPSDVLQWKACDALLPHARAALQSATELDLTPLRRAQLLDRIGVFLMSEAQFSAAEADLRSALAVLEETNPEHQATAATVRNHLGSLRAELGDFDSAYSDHAAALAVHEKVCGPDSREAAEDRLNIGRILIERDDMAGARAQFEKALRILTNIFDAHHIAMIECYDALFGLNLRVGNVLEARRHLRQSLDAREALGQQDHPDALWYRFIDDRLFGDDLETSSSSRFEEIISFTERAITDRHPEIANWRQWLADELLSQQEFDRAEENYRKALEIDEAAYNDKHWRVARDLLRIFLIQAVNNQVDDARQTLIQAIRILQQIPITDSIIEDPYSRGLSGFVLTKFDEALDRLSDVFAAVQPFDRICEIVADTFGRDTPLYASALEHFAVELQETGHRDYLKHGLRFLNTAHGIFVSHYGPNHRRVAECLRYLGSLQAANGDTEDAAASYARALTILDEENQPNQIELLTVLTGFYPVLVVREKRAAIRASRIVAPDGSAANSSPAQAVEAGYTARVILERALVLATSAIGVGPLIRLAGTLVDASQLEQALEIYEQVLEMLEEAYGGRRLIVANCLRQIGSLLTALGDPSAALRRYDEALDIHRTLYGPEDLSVAEDLRLRALSFARLGDAASAAENLERSLAMIERLDKPDAAVMNSHKIRQWSAVGDAAGDPGTAHTLYQIGLDRTRDLPGTGQLRARMGCIAAIRDDLIGALEYFRASISHHITEDGHDPFWATVRDATPAANSSTDRKRLTAILSTLREDPSMREQLRTFRPQITAIIPQDWNAKESITFLAPDGQANVIASSEPLDPEIDTYRYAETQGDILHREFPEYEELEFEEVELFDDRRGYIRHFEWKPPDGARVSQIQLYYAESSRGYTVTATTPTSNFARAEVELRQLLSGIRLSR